MRRPLLVVFLAEVLAAWGCSTDRPLLPPGEDPDAVAAAVVAKGQETRAADPAPPESATVPAKCFQAAVNVGWVCVIVPYFLLSAIAHCNGLHYP